MATPSPLRRTLRAALRCTGAAVCVAQVLGAATLAGAQTIDVAPFRIVTANAARPDIAGGPDGSMIVVWTDPGNGSFGRAQYNGYARRFAGDGTPLSEPILLGTAFDDARIAALPAGGYAVSWRVYQADDVHPLVGSLLDAAGAPSAPPIDVHGNGDGLHYAAVAGLDGGPVFLWDQGTMWARRFDGSGQALEAPRVVDDDDAYIFYMPLAIAAMPGGGYVAAWFNVLQHSSRARIFDAAGAPIGNWFSAGDFDVFDVAANATGICTVGSSGASIYLQRFSLDGFPVGSRVLVHDGNGAIFHSSAVELDARGNALVVWTHNSYAVQTAIVDTGNHVTPAVLIQAGGGYPIHLTALADGRFAATWSYGFAWAAVLSACGSGSPGCGDGVTTAPCEQCDQGAGNSDTLPDACRTNCLAAHCGDGVVDAGEECDDGGHIAGDGCDQYCRIQACGNGRIEGAEECDDQNLVDDDGCDSNCRVTACGNGVVTSAEECDDGNSQDGDACDHACLIEQCGSGRVEGRETCDDGNLIDGDGCDSNCTPTNCGNGILTALEECDDGNFRNGDGCDRTCLVEQCGNGRTEGDEACDDGNLVSGDGCDADCTPSPRVDPVLRSVRPVQIVLAADAAAVDKVVTVVLENADAAPQTFRVGADHGTCPADAIAVGPDFDPGQAGAQDTVALAPGRRARATVTLHFARGSLPAIDRNAPGRCAITLGAGPAAPGSVDATPSNGALAITVDVVDRAAPTNAQPEFYLRRLNPLRLRIPSGNVASQRNVRLRAQAPAGGTSFAFQVSDGDCPPGTLTLVAQNAAGSATVSVRAGRGFFTTPNQRAPTRCNAVVSASASGDTDAANNATTLTLDVVDSND